MNVVMTGATSFLGTAIIRKLLLSNHQVFAVVRPDSANRGALKTVEEEFAAGEQSQLDVHRDWDEQSRPGALHVIELELEHLERLKDYVPVPCGIFLHLGWDGAGSENRTKKEKQQKNIPDTLKALESARELGCRRFLFSGSQAEYGVCQSLMSEDITCCPVSEYGKAKVEASRQAADLCRKWREDGVYQMEYVHVRIFSIYGTGDHPWSLVNTCLDTFTKDGHMDLGACTQQWNFLYIDDLADGVLSLMFCEHLPEESGAGAGIYNIAGDADATMPLRQYVEAMYELCGKCGSFTYGRLPLNAEGPANLIPDIRKLKEVAGWRPRVSFDEGIRRMIAENKAAKDWERHTYEDNQRSSTLL